MVNEEGESTPQTPTPQEPRGRRRRSPPRAERRPPGDARQDNTKAEATRRKVLATGFFGGLTVTVLGSLGLLAKFIWPLDVKGFGGTFTITPDRLPKKGNDQVKILEAKASVVNT